MWGVSDVNWSFASSRAFAAILSNPVIMAKMEPPNLTCSQETPWQYAVGMNPGSLNHPLTIPVMLFLPSLS